MRRLPRLLRAAGAVCAVAAVATACTGTPRAEPSQTVIVHASRALPGHLPESLDRLDGVRWTRVATTAMVNLIRIDGGKPLAARAAGTVLPFSIGAAEPLPVSGDRISAELAAGRAVLSTTSARLRNLRPGDAIVLGLEMERERVEVGAVIDDPRTVEVEALVPLSVAIGLGVTEIRDVVAGVSRSDTAGFETHARRLASPVPVRVGTSSDVDTPEAGQLLSLADIKERFGEFSFVAGSGRWLEPDRAWQDANIVGADVPVLGRMRCHRKVMGPLASAMRELQTAGLAGLVVEPSFCYAPRVQFGDTRVISRHTWGIAVDINPTANAFGSPPTQDPRLVEIMRRHGFAWGGVWLTPDGMHFEYTGL